MFRRGVFFRVLGAILLLVLFVAGGFAIHRAGVAQGYALGVATAQSETGELPDNPALMMPYMYARPFGGWYGYGFHPFGGFGFIFSLFFGLLFLFFITRLIFRPWGWAGPHTYWKHHGGVPPWVKDWEKGETKGEEKSPENADQ